MPRGRPRKSGSTLPPSYFESHGKVYHVTAKGWRPVGTASDAHAEYSEKLRQGSEGQLNPLIDAALATMKSRKSEPLSENTKDAYTRAAKKLKHLLRKFTSPEQVKQRDAAMVKKLLAPTPGMANRVISFAREIFSGWLEDQLIEYNPFTGIKRFKMNRRTRLIEQAEWDKIYNHKETGQRLKCIMDGLFLTDQRIGDVLTIDERDILDDGPGIYFKQQKTGKELIVAWNPQIREWIARCRALHGKVVKVDFEIKGRPRYLFRSNRGGRVSYKTLYPQWVRAVEAAGIENCNLHDNRAFSATEAQRQGLDPQKLLGHDDARTTRVYLRGREIDIVQGPQMKRTA